MGRPKRYSNWLNLANKPFEKDHIELPVDSTPWYSAWRVKQLPKLATFSRFTVPESPYGCETGSSKGWTVCWRGIALDVRRLLSDDQQRELTDILDSGPVAYGFTSGVWTCPMVARVIDEEFSVSYHPAHVSRILHELKFSVQRPKNTLAQADKTHQSRWIRYQYPNIKKKPKSKERPSSSRTKRASGKTQPSIEHGRG